MATAGTPTPPNATQISQDHDAILTYRKLIPTLKEALVTIAVMVLPYECDRKQIAILDGYKHCYQNLMQTGAQALQYNMQADVCMKGADTLPIRFDRKLEEFHSICDQMELNLRLAIESYNQHIHSNHFTPIPVQGLPRSDGQPPNHPTDTQTYAQYMHTVQTQINCCKEMHDVLVECARNVETSSGNNTTAGMVPGAGILKPT